MGSGTWYGVPNYGEYVDRLLQQGPRSTSTASRCRPRYDEFEDVLDAFVDGRASPRSPRPAPSTRSASSSTSSRSRRPTARSSTTTSSTRTPSTCRARRSPTRPRRSPTGSTRATSRRTRPASRPRTWASASSAASTRSWSRARWWYGRVHQRDRRLRVGHVPLPRHRPRRPDRRATSGSSPRTRTTRSSPYEFIDITMRPEIQALIGNNGGVPGRGRPGRHHRREDRRSSSPNFNTVAEQDGLAFYPDWPAPNFYDAAGRRAPGARERHQDARPRCSSSSASTTKTASPTSPDDPVRRPAGRSCLASRQRHRHRPAGPPGPSKGSDTMVSTLAAPADAAVATLRRHERDLGNPLAAASGSSSSPASLLFTFIIADPAGVERLPQLHRVPRASGRREWIGLDNWIELARRREVLGVVPQLARDDRRDGRRARRCSASCSPRCCSTSSASKFGGRRRQLPAGHLLPAADPARGDRRRS